MMIDEWAGCKADKCPYGKEYGDCDTCNYLIRKTNKAETGMPIEEYMKVLQEVPKVMPITKESINVALETMQKYEKIEQIYSDYLDDMDAEKLADKLGEVF